MMQHGLWTNPGEVQQMRIIRIQTTIGTSPTFAPTTSDDLRCVVRRVSSMLFDPPRQFPDLPAKASKPSLKQVSRRLA